MKSMITGIGWVTARSMGCGKDHDHFEMKEGKLPDINRREVFDKPYRHFGRMDKYSRLGLCAVAFALKDSGQESWVSKRNIGIIASTVHGCLYTDVEYFKTVMPQQGRLASPNLFAYTLPTCFLGEAAIRFGLTGTGFVISNPSTWDLGSLRMALISLASGELEKVLAGACDLGCPEPIAEIDNTGPGALFFMIEKNCKTERRNYGALRLDRKGDLFFNQVEVSNLAGLAQECLATLPTRNQTLKTQKEEEAR